MSEYLTGQALASFLERDTSSALDNIADRTNALIDEEWANPVTPIPQWVVNIAWNVALRASRNIEGVTSATKSWDDITVTKRWEAGEPDGVYLTDDERLRLNSDGDDGATPATTPAKSIRMVIPGWSRPPCS
jgi:hypothetical protein